MQLYKDPLIPKTPKIIFLLFIIITIPIICSIEIGIYNLYNLLIYFFIIWVIYEWIEDYYNEKIDHSKKFKVIKENLTLFIIVLGPTLLFLLLFIIIIIITK